MAPSVLGGSTTLVLCADNCLVVWAIFSDTMQEDSVRAKIAVDGATTGLAKIMALLDHMADQLAKFPAKVRFLAQFDAMYARDWPVERLLTLEGELNKNGFEVFGTLIREGLADGSLRSDLDPDLTLHAVKNAIVAAQRRLASLGTKVEVEYGQSVDRLFRKVIRILEFGLCATEPRNGVGLLPGTNNSGA